MEKMHLIIPFLGTIIPKMRTSILNALFTGVKQRVLSILFTNPEKSFYFNELMNKSGSGASSLNTELRRLTSSGVVLLTPIGRQKHYQANKNSIIYQELRSILLKTSGESIASEIKTALEDSGAKIHLAFIYGSVSKNTDGSDSDIDVLLVTDDLAYADLYELTAGVEESLSRKISTTLYTLSEFNKRIDSGNHFVSKILDQPKIFIIGGENDIPRGKPEESRQSSEN